MTRDQFKRLLQEAVDDADENGTPNTHVAVLATTDEVRERDLKNVTTLPSGRKVGIVTVYMARLLLEGWRPIVADSEEAA